MKKTSKLLSALLVVSQVFGCTPAVFANEEPTSLTLSSESATVQEGNNGVQTEETIDSTPETTPEAPPTDSSTEEQPVEPEQKPEENQPVEESKPTDSTTTQTSQKPTETPTNQPNVSAQSGVSANVETSTTNQGTAAPVVDEVKEYHQDPSASIQELVPESKLSSDGTIHFEKNESVEQFIQKIGEAARKAGQENDLYASVMIAQAILESASGQSLLSKAPNYNLFGIKGTHNGKGVSFATQEDLGNGTLYTAQATFRQYQSYEESLKDYAKLLKEGVAGNASFYEGVWKSKAKTYQEATQYLTGRYATDSQYNQKLDGLIETYDLTMYDHPKATVEMTESDFPAYNGENYDTSNSYAWGNCTQYVYNRITQLGKHIDLTMGNGKDWGVTGQVRGYEVSRTPQAGTAASFPAGVLGADTVYGHVAFVEKVNPDGSIYISEMNVQGLNVVSTRTIPANQTSMLNYITPK
ncbi:glucosaminidase domain-containing protein [Enterococcus faecalis]|uniref:glucosaminidase domain-containing protein n=1 Tax=Enterococcus faecalis TaxID=1351 RepID=UPI0025AFB988|nr:glucosaminidase domain-containing protein [Enterococcus faecalis]MDN3202360.1 glucosaminidase domain-containing protein [Enterococcus faecalis]